MPELRLEVWDRTNASQIRVLSKAYDPVLADSLWVPGEGMFRVDLDHTADIDALGYRRKVRWFLDNNLVQTTIVADRPTVVRDPGERPSLLVRGPTLLGEFGYDKGGGALWPRGGLAGLQQNPRVFGWMALDFDDSSWTTPVSHGLQGELTHPYARRPRGVDWPDPEAAWIWGEAATGSPLTNPAGTNYIRWPFTTSTAVQARFYGSLDNKGLFYIDGDLLYEQQGFESLGGKLAKLRDLTLPAGNHLIGAQCRNFPTIDENPNPGGVLWTLWTLDGNGEPAELIAHSQVAGAKALAYPPSVPGVTVGYVAKVLTDEAKARGALDMLTYDFTAVNDSSSSAWLQELTHSFSWSRLGRLWDQLQQFEGEVRISPTGVVQFFKRAGQDRTGTVLFTLPYEASLTGEGPVATDLLTETPDGARHDANSAAVTAYGRLEDVLTLGTGVDPAALGGVVTSALMRSGNPHDEVTFEARVVDTLLPYVDVNLGDDVTANGRDGDAPYRLTRWTVAQDDSGTVLLQASGAPNG